MGTLVTAQIPNRLEKSQKWKFLNDDESPGWKKIKNLESGLYLESISKHLLASGKYLNNHFRLGVCLVSSSVCHTIGF